MADKTTKSLLEEINYHTASIEDNSKRHFGTKMPDASKDEEQELSFVQMIMGSMGAMVWGLKNTTDSSKIKSALNRNENIYTLINDIKKSITAESKSFNVKFTKEYIDKTIKPTIINPIIEKLNSLEQTIKNSKESNKNNNFVVQSDIQISDDLIDDINTKIIDNLKTIIDSYKAAVDDDIKNRKNNIVLQSTVQIPDDILKNIKENIVDPLNTIIESLNNIGSTNGTVELGKLDINFKNANISDITSLLEELGKIKNTNKDAYVGFSNLLDFFESLSELVDDEHIKEKIQKLKLIIDSNKIGLAGLLNSINNISNDSLGIKNDMSNVNSMLHTIITIISIDPKSINLKGLRTLIKVSNSNGEIFTLINNLKEIAKNHISNNSLSIIESFFDAVKSIAEINRFDRLRIKSNIKFFNKFIGVEIPKLIEEIAKSNDKIIKPEVINSIDALTDIFQSLTKIGELNFKDKIRMKINLMFIRYFVVNEITELLSLISESIKNVSSDAFISIEQLNNLFNMLFEVSEKSFLQMLKLSINLSIIEDIIKANLIGTGDIGILNILSKIDEKVLQTAYNNTEKINDLFNELNDVINNELTIKDCLLFMISTSLMSKSINNIDIITNELRKFNSQTLLSIINKTSKLKEIFNNLNNINENTSLIRVTLTYASLLIHRKNVNIIKEIINILNEIKPDENINSVIDIISDLMEIKGGVSNAKSLNKTLDVIKNSIEKIKEISNEIKDIKDNDLKRINTVLKSFNDIIIKAAGILLLGGTIMGIINPLDLITFTICLGGFLWGISYAFKNIASSLQDDIKIAKEAVNLILISGSILMVGGIVMNIIDPLQLVSFAFILWAFIMGVSLAYKIFGSESKETFEGAKSFSLLIAISGAILIAGGLFIAMGLGEHAKAFAWILGVFIAGVTFAYAKAAGLLNLSLFAAKGIALLVGISGAVLMIGALFMTSPKRIVGVLAFAAILGLFIFAIIKTITSVRKDIFVSLSTMIAISTLITVASFTLLLGGGLFALFPSLPGNVIFFAIILTAFIGLICGMCFLLQKYGQYIINGIGILTGIITIIGLSAIAISLVAISTWLIEKAGGHWKILATLGIMVAAIGAIAVICRIIGEPEIAGFIGLGEIVMAGIIVILILGAIAMAALVAVVKYASSITQEQIDTVFGKETFQTGVLGKAIWGMVKLGPAFIALGAELPLMIPGILATIALSTALAIIAKTISMWADLKIPEYNAKGEIIGYKTIDDQAFEMAATNIKSVLTTLFGAIQEVYEENKEIFSLSWDWSTFLSGGKTPFARVISSSQNIGKMLSSIAHGIQTWADLKYPIYGDNGKIITYKTIDDAIFTRAADNIKKVIVSLGAAILEVYDEAPEGMFESKEWFGLGRTPFSKVVRALKTMGPMLSSIAKGIQTWADLKYPIYGEDGKIAKYKKLENDDLINAKDNIIKITCALAGAVLEVYEQAPEGMFDDDSWHGFGSTPFSKVCKSLKTMGTALSNIGDAIKLWSDLKIPVYGDKKDLTKITEYKPITDDIFQKVSENIAYVVTYLASAIASLANDPTLGPMLTDDDFWSGKTPVAKVLQSIHPLGSALKDIADAIIAWSTMRIPQYDDAKNPTKITSYKKLSFEDIKQAQNNISQVIEGLINGVGQIYEKHEDLFDEGGFLGCFKSDSPVAQVINAIGPLAKSLQGMATMLKSWAELKIPIYGNSNSLEPTSYLSIGGTTGIAKATENIQNVISALIKAVATVYYGKLTIKDGNKIKTIEYEDLFKKDDKSIINKISKQLSKLPSLFDNIKKSYESIISISKLCIENSELIDSFINNHISKINECIIKLSTIGNVENNEKAIDDLFELTNSKRINEELTLYSQSIRSIIDAVIYSKNVTEESYNGLRDGIIKLYNTIKEIEITNEFKQFGEDLDKYISSINKIDITRIDSLSNLVDSLNLLAGTFGNLDKLTDAISERLSAVLLELVNQLRKADASIKSAHDLQEKRKKLIEEAVKEVKEIMGQKMIVEISQVLPDDDDPDKNKPGKDPAQSVGGQRENGERGGGDDTVNHVENGTYAPQSAPTNIPNAEPLTEDRFKELIKQNIAQWAKGRPGQI